MMLPNSSRMARAETNGVEASIMNARAMRQSPSPAWYAVSSGKLKTQVIK